jgi:hypothetical protein
MDSREIKWGLLILFIVLLGYLLPYTVFTETPHWYGSFLLWSLLALAIIVINYLFTRNWGE